MGILRRESDGREVLLATELVVGRMPSCGLVLSHSFISLAHALVRWNGGQWELRDLGSTNGTHANGRRLAPGDSASLTAGTTVTFGNSSETWCLIDDAPPAPAAIPLDGGEPRFFVAGAIAIPDASDPSALVLLEDAAWVLESAEARVAISNGSHFTAAGRQWRFECSAAATATFATQQRESLLNARLVLRPSLDEEHIQLTLFMGTSVKRFGERTCFYLLLVLARRRLLDERDGVLEPGWIEVEELLRMIPEYSHSSLNVEVHRLRRLLHDAGLGDAAGIVERRRGEMRIGTSRLEIRSEEVGLEATGQP